MGRYAFSRSWGREEERLAALERQLDPVSQAAIGQLGLAAGWRCWEAGAGGGSMAAWLASRVAGGGSVLATDIDISGLSGLRQAHITVARHDLERKNVPWAGFDLIHARLVLEHLREPAAIVAKLASALRAGGWLLLEDADGLLFDAEPAAKAFAAIAGPWQRAALAAGWNPLYGRCLVTDLRMAGLGRVAGRAHRSYQPGGEAWLAARLGLERMRDQIRHEGASQDDLDAALAALDDHTRTVIGGPIVASMPLRAALPWRHVHEFTALTPSSTAVTDRVATPIPARLLRPIMRYRHRQLAGDLAAHQRARQLRSQPLTVAITGSSGLIGSALTALLASGGHRVIRLVRGAPAEENERRWDPEDRDRRDTLAETASI